MFQTLHKIGVVLGPNCHLPSEDSFTNSHPIFDGSNQVSSKYLLQDCIQDCTGCVIYAAKRALRSRHNWDTEINKTEIKIRST